MRDQPKAFASLGKAITLKRLFIMLTMISTMGLGLWAWIQQYRHFLPTPDSKAGRALQHQYQGTAHDIWLILLLIVAGYLISKIYISRQKEAEESKHNSKGAVQSCLQFIRNNPITTVLFAAYTVAMIAGTTYLYKDMVGWYADLVDGYFLDNFSLKGSFIRETMRRTDYRFFPLAHQDIHILSWFSIQIKTWMLFSAAELIGTVLLCIKFLNNLEKQDQARAGTILFITSLLLIHPSTGTAFFHVIYCERMLCLVFMLYINAYLDHSRTGHLSSFYSTLLWALIGIFIKDISILLFVIPPTSLWIADVIHQRRQTPHETQSVSPFSPHYRLEHWICSLPLVFICSYIILALIPSSYAAEGAYNNGASYYIFLDLRFYLFALVAASRAIAIAKERIRFNFLDAINIAAFAYAISLSCVYEFDSTSYLALPFQLIASINIAWAWIQLTKKKKGQIIKHKKEFLGAIIASTTILTTDHMTSKNTFIANIVEQKTEQLYIQSTYEKLDEITRKIREEGNHANIIIHEQSRLSAYRHLNRIPYRALIEYIPSKEQFIIKDGENKGKIYSPMRGDLVANLDKSIDLIDPILENLETEIIYRHNPTKKTGLILKITGTKR